MQEIEQLYAARSAYIIIIMVIMAGFTSVRYAHTNIFRNTYQPIALFSFRPMEEQAAGIKLLSTENLLITLLLAASMAFSIMIFGQFFRVDLGFFDLGGPQSFLLLLGFWLILVLGIGILFLIKFAFLALLGWLFDFPLSQSAHYQEFQSMSHVFNFFFALVLGVGLIAMSSMNETFMKSMGIIFVIFFIIRQFILFLRLYSKGTYSIYYIFSYICSTELIPWIICLGIVFGG